MKWCPAPGCDYAIDFVAGSGIYDVTCLCSYSFCWNVSFSQFFKVHHIPLLFCIIQLLLLDLKRSVPRKPIAL